MGPQTSPRNPQFERNSSPSNSTDTSLALVDNTRAALQTRSLQETQISSSLALPWTEQTGRYRDVHQVAYISRRYISIYMHPIGSMDGIYLPLSIIYLHWSSKSCNMSNNIKPLILWVSNVSNKQHLVGSLKCRQHLRIGDPLGNCFMFKTQVKRILLED